MSFMNVAKAGVENFSKYGKFIGQGKNNGIKVYEAVRGDGTKVLSSLNKDGELIKKITKDTFNTRVDNLVDNTTTWTSRNKYWNGVKPYIKYKYTKIFPKGNSMGLEIASLDRSYGGDILKDYKIGYKKSEEVINALRSNENKHAVSMYQKMEDGGTIALEKVFPKAQATIKTEGNYKLTPDIQLKNGESVYTVHDNGILTHADSNNPHDQNLAQMLFDSAKKLWS